MADACWDCLVDHHAQCEFIGDDDPGMRDEDWYSVVCCCGAWGETRQSVSAQYREMNEQLKPLQWPDAER